MPSGRNIQPEDVAAAVTLLASDDASGINGIDLQVDAEFAQIGRLHHTALTGPRQRTPRRESGVMPGRSG
jgi:hypothetical protein